MTPLRGVLGAAGRREGEGDELERRARRGIPGEIAGRCTAKNATLEGKRFVLTGRFKAHSRKDAEALLKKQGAATSGSVSGKTDVLIFARFT